MQTYHNRSRSLISLEIVSSNNQLINYILELGIYCTDSLGVGVETKRIPNGFMSASTELDPDNAAFYGRLHNPEFSWTPDYEDKHPYLQIFLGNRTRTTAIATQGHPRKKWFAMQYTLQFSNDGVTWSDYVDRFHKTVVR